MERCCCGGSQERSRSAPTLRRRPRGPHAEPAQRRRLIRSTRRRRRGGVGGGDCGGGGGEEQGGGTWRIRRGPTERSAAAEALVAKKASIVLSALKDIEEARAAAKAGRQPEVVKRLVVIGVCRDVRRRRRCTTTASAEEELAQALHEKRSVAEANAALQRHNGRGSTSSWRQRWRAHSRPQSCGPWFSHSSRAAPRCARALGDPQQRSHRAHDGGVRSRSSPSRGSVWDSSGASGSLAGMSSSAQQEQ